MEHKGCTNAMTFTAIHLGSGWTQFFSFCDLCLV